MTAPRPFSRDQLIRVLKHFADPADYIYASTWSDRDRLLMFMRAASSWMLAVMGECVVKSMKVE